MPTPPAARLRVLLALAQLAAARGYNEWTLVAAVDRNRWCAPPARDPLSTNGAPLTSATIPRAGRTARW